MFRHTPLIESTGNDRWLFLYSECDCKEYPREFTFVTSSPHNIYSCNKCGRWIAHHSIERPHAPINIG